MHRLFLVLQKTIRLQTIYQAITLLVISSGFIYLFTQNTLTAYAANPFFPAITKDQLDLNENPPLEIKSEQLSSAKNFPDKPMFSTKTKDRKYNLIKVDPKKLYLEIIKSTEKFQFPAEDPNFLLDLKNNKVNQFSPGKNGSRLDAVASIKAVMNDTKNIDQTVTIKPVTIRTAPRKTLEHTNSLGINTLLAKGVSVFPGSSKNRRKNIHVAAEKMKGILIGPGKDFSFNEYVGEVTAEDGFVPEIVIKKDGLKPELGGGVCQVSSTVFRAAVASGMPIKERKNHSFPVQHYAPQGTDATTYTGVVDLKFTNDTTDFILIWPVFLNDNTLEINLYGTDDGRKVKVYEPVKYDFKPDGVFKTKWEREVTKLKEAKRTDSFISTYLPAAWFKKEESFVASKPSDAPTSANQDNPNPNKENISEKTDQTSTQNQLPVQ